MTDNQTQKKEIKPAQNIPLNQKVLQGWEKFSSWVWETPKKDGTLLTRFLRWVCRIIFIVIRESQNDRVTLRASALTFTVVLSLVPMLALGTAVLKGLGAGDQMRQAAYSLIEQFDSAAENLEFIPGQDQPP